MSALVRLVPLPVVVALGVVGCATDTDDPLPPASATAEDTAPPSATTRVSMLYTGLSDERVRGLDYEVSVALGEPLDGGAGCDLAAPEGTVTVPVTLRVVNTHDPDSVDPTPPVQADGSGEGEPVLWATPRYVEAAPVGGAGPLRWAPERSGYPCTDQPDLESFVSLGWEYREQATLTGYLTGVPETAPEGAGVRLDLVRELWEVHQGAPGPVTVTY